MHFVVEDYFSIYDFNAGIKKNEFKNKMQFKVNYTPRIWKISDSNNISQESVLLSKSGM